MSRSRSQSRWTKIRSHLLLATVAAFVLTAIWARINPSLADEAPAAKAPPATAPASPSEPAKAKNKLDRKKKARAEATAKRIAPASASTTTAAKLDHLALARAIDQQVHARLQAESIKSSPLADDAEFLRRVYLDLAGVIPPSDKVEEFLKSTDPSKRSKVIDDLLASPRFGTSMAEVWSGLMVPRESNNRRLDHTPIQKWLAAEFNAGKPLDKLVYEVLTATGPQDQNGAVTYYIGNPTVDKITDSVSRMFLGVQLQCAQCHNHPFTDWKQNEYWGMAAFFMKVKASANPNQAAKKGSAIVITEGPGVAKKKAALPESAKMVPAKFFGAEEPKLNSADPYRPVLAKWLVAEQNPYFAKAMVNRFWHHLFGRGLVNPVDDMHAENKASHPEMLDLLTAQLKSNEFDMKYLLRAICNSETYQRTSRPFAGNEADPDLYSHAAARALRAEQLYDSLTQVMGNPADDDMPKNRNNKKGPIGNRENFLAFFRIDEGANALEYQAGIPQALRLMNSQITNASNATIARASKSGDEPAQVIQQLYLMALSRRPEAEELQKMQAYVARAGDARTGYADLLWALLNSSEFTLNH